MNTSLHLKIGLEITIIYLQEIEEGLLHGQIDTEKEIASGESLMHRMVVNTSSTSFLVSTCMSPEISMDILKHMLKQALFQSVHAALKCFTATKKEG